MRSPKPKLPDPHQPNAPLVVLTQGTYGQRRYLIDGGDQRYMSAREVKFLLEEIGFSRNPKFLRAYRKLSHQDPLTEGEVFSLNYALARLQKEETQDETKR